ncbi:hypothetical protein BH18CHL2_BH18CHL2_04720 [soil metagenome]
MAGPFALGVLRQFGTGLAPPDPTAIGANGAAARTRRRELSSNRETTIVDNEVYNVITTAANKLEGLAAYDKYQADGSANDPIWAKLREQDQQAVRQLLEQLDKFAKDGKLRAK